MVRGRRRVGGLPRRAEGRLARRSVGGTLPAAQRDAPSHRERRVRQGRTVEEDRLRLLVRTVAAAPELPSRCEFLSETKKNFTTIGERDAYLPLMLTLPHYPSPRTTPLSHLL